MADERKFSFLRLSIEPISSREGECGRGHLVSLTDGVPGEEQSVYLKPAFFFSAVAILLILASQLGHVKDNPNSSSASAPAAGIELALYPQRHAESHSSLVIGFRLSNTGNHPVFYPAHPGTNVPLGQVVTRTSSSSEWVILSATVQRQEATDSESIEGKRTWLEMPPGGWADGEFYDPGWPDGDYAYAVELKQEPKAEVIRIVSPAYHVTN